jgi:glycosyltransferase involved in cell wall biosynthesis
MPFISLCMIAKHEALTIERTIESAKEIVSEVVVGIDRASTDGTREIVARLGCRAIDINLSAELAAKRSLDSQPDWGFSKARNTVLDACDPGNWRLILDGHELLCDPVELKNAIEEAVTKNCDCIDVKVAFEPDRNGIPQTVFESTRAIAPSVRYSNPQHNVAVVKRRHSAFHVTVEHRKCDQAISARAERNAQRADSNIAGFESRVAIEPANARAWFYLATAYKESLRYADAVPAFAECLKYSRWNEERWHARVDSGRCLMALGRMMEARDQFSLALDEHRERAEGYYYLGDLAYKQQRFREALAWLEKCVSMPMPHCRLFLNPRIYLIDRHDLLAMVYHHVGRFDLAIEQAKLALAAAPSVPNKRIETNLSIWQEYVAGNKPAC